MNKYDTYADVKNLRVYLRGGLGNQLFQYAAGYAIARRQQMGLLLDTSLLQSSVDRTRRVTLWQEEISSFKHAGSFFPVHRTGRARSSAIQRLNQLERVLGDSFGLGLTAKWGSLASEKRSLISHSDLIKQIRIKRINAYVAHPVFFEDVQDSIREQINHLVEPSDFFQKMDKEITSDQPIVIHLRLGDYLRFPRVFGTFSSTYFDRALELVKSKAGDRAIWVFSDEPNRARALLSESFRRANFVAAPKASRPLESMILLSKSPYKILSNSTFSWWSAFLGKQEENLTVFPKPFMAGFTDDSLIGFLDDNWVQLDRAV